MIEVLHQVTVEEPKAVEVRAVPIRAAGAAIAVPKAAPQPDYPMAFGNPAQNSRLPGSLPSGAGSVRWQANLNPSFATNHVVQAADRVLTEGGGTWRLFDAGGKSVTEGRYMGSHVVLDAAHSLFYFIDTDNFLTALQMSNAKKLFMTSPTFGDNFIRPLIARRNNRFVLAGMEQEGSAHRPEAPNQSVIEYDDLAPELKTDETGLLFSLTATGKLLIRSNKVAAAMSNDTVVFAVPGRIYTTSSDMKPKAAFDGDFEPVTLSLDETGRIYLIALQNGHHELRILSSDGMLIGAYPLKAGLNQLLAPPIVGYDHRVFLVSSSTIVTLDSSGKLLWESATRAPVTGAAVTADGHLLISAGSEISAFDDRGRPVTLHSFAGDSLTTPPVLTAKGELLVASRSHLYCLDASGH